MLQFSVLASGSAGNAALLQADGVGVLIDAGIGPRQMASRLAAAGQSWDSIQLAVLTHTHTDHWRERTFEHFVRRKIPVCCHAEHVGWLSPNSEAFARLQQAGLVRTYQANSEMQLGNSIRCTPIEVSHDSIPTFSFRFAGTSDLFGNAWSLGYLADLGCWKRSLVEAFQDVDVLALEFNHDETMERNSRRPTELIDRVLGDMGHLSNAQAAAFLNAIVSGSNGRSLQHLVQLHLSRECNRPSLARRSAVDTCAGLDVPPKVHTASQDQAGPMLTLAANRSGRAIAAATSECSNG